MIMRLGFGIAVVMFSLTGPALSQSVEADTQTVLTCLYKVGADRAALNRPAGCQGIVSGPCLPEAPNTSETLECVGRETAAWTSILNTAYGELKMKLPKAKFNTLRKKQIAWQKKLPSRCAVEDEGSLALVEKQYCQMGLFAARATQLYQAAQKAKK
jgi:uncharacterized protein YecT (DUF1311 family)